MACCVVDASKSMIYYCGDGGLDTFLDVLQDGVNELRCFVLSAYVASLKLWGFRWDNKLEGRLTCTFCSVSVLYKASES